MSASSVLGSGAVASTQIDAGILDTGAVSDTGVIDAKTLDAGVIDQPRTLSTKRIFKEDSEPRLHPTKEVRTKSFITTLETVIVTASIFVTILAWYEFIRSFFEHVYPATKEDHPSIDFVVNRFFFALFITILAFFVCLIIIVFSGMSLF